MPLMYGIVAAVVGVKLVVYVSAVSGSVNVTFNEAIVVVLVKNTSKVFVFVG